jgi:hypothetical protein
MSDRLHAAEMPRLHAFDEEFQEDVEDVVDGRPRKIVQRLLMLAVVVLGGGAITMTAVLLCWMAASANSCWQKGLLALSAHHTHSW